MKYCWFHTLVSHPCFTPLFHTLLQTLVSYPCAQPCFIPAFTYASKGDCLFLLLFTIVEYMDCPSHFLCISMGSYHLNVSFGFYAILHLLSIGAYGFPVNILSDSMSCLLRCWFLLVSIGFTYIIVWAYSQTVPVDRNCRLSALCGQHNC